MSAVEDKDKQSLEQLPEEQVLLRWTTHPVRLRPVAAVVVTVLIFLTGMVVYYATASKMFGGLTLLLLFLSLSKFYLPTIFTLTDRSVSIKTTTQTIRKEWSQYRSFYPDKNGVLLSPFVEPSRLENFRGVYLIFAGNRDEVLSVVSQQIEVSKAPSEKSQGNAT